MYIITVEFIVKPDYSDRFAWRVIKQAEDSLSRENHCHVFDVCRGRESNEQLFLYEGYEDEAAFQKHLQSEHFKAFDAECRDWVVSKSVASYERIS